MKNSKTNACITFEQGLPGYENLKYFSLDQPYKEYPFFSLDSLDHKDISFIIINPFQFNKKYEFNLPALQRSI
ncbi:hypothetical protein N752_21885 [Desulforamulus aquiferis]|nr:flagellar assembly protein FliW [Desulforamulus aquiferis]RYD03064.1 hypothetical protein N752_21885 [Desulforamulus aquiferis]